MNEAGPILDPRADEWIYDCTVLRSFYAGGILDILAKHMAGRSYLAEEVHRETQRSPASKGYAGLPPWRTVLQLQISDVAEYARLVRRFSSDPQKNKGEAETILLARDKNLNLVTDDGTAYRSAASDFNLCATRTPPLLVSFVRANYLPAQDAWNAFNLMLAAGRHFGPLPWKDHADFTQLCARPGFDPC